MISIKDIMDQISIWKNEIEKYLKRKTQHELAERDDKEGEDARIEEEGRVAMEEEKKVQALGWRRKRSKCGVRELSVVRCGIITSMEF